MSSTAAMSLMFKLPDWDLPDFGRVDAAPFVQLHEQLHAQLNAQLHAQVPSVMRLDLNAPQLPPAPWLGLVEQRIEKSLRQDEHADDESGAWISRGVVNSAVRYFRQVSDLLPGEPYLYSATGDDLIAEFRVANGRLVTVVTEGVVQTIALRDGVPTAEQPVQVWADNIDLLRQGIKKQLSQMSKGANGGDTAS